MNLLTGAVVHWTELLSTKLVFYFTVATQVLAALLVIECITQVPGEAASDDASTGASAPCV